MPAPPPGAAGQPQLGPSQTTPAVASPSPAMASDPTRKAAFQVLQIVQNTRALAQQFPTVSPLVQQVNDLLQQIQMKIAQSTAAGEPAAPPVA
jgi:hypothetical protein